MNPLDWAVGLVKEQVLWKPGWLRSLVAYVCCIQHQMIETAAVKKARNSSRTGKSGLHPGLMSVGVNVYTIQ